MDDVKDKITKRDIDGRTVYSVYIKSPNVSIVGGDTKYYYGIIPIDPRVPGAKTEGDIIAELLALVKKDWEGKPFQVVSVV